MILAGASSTVTVRLNGEGRKLLRRFHTLPITVIITLSSSGKPTISVRQRLTVKQTRMRKR